MDGDGDLDVYVTNSVGQQNKLWMVSVIEPAVCGNNSIESGEQCDDGNTVTETCSYGEESCQVCNATCQTVAGVTEYCGDGSITNGETCDDGANNGEV